MNIETLRFELKRPLLIMKAPNGFLACGYINAETCNKTEEACAIVSGVSDYEDMKKASIVAVSKKAADLGISVRILVKLATNNASKLAGDNASTCPLQKELQAES